MAPFDLDPNGTLPFWRLLRDRLLRRSKPRHAPAKSPAQSCA